MNPMPQPKPAPTPEWHYLQHIKAHLDTYYPDGLPALPVNGSNYSPAPGPTAHEIFDGVCSIPHMTGLRFLEFNPKDQYAVAARWCAFYLFRVEKRWSYERIARYFKCNRQTVMRGVKLLPNLINSIPQATSC